MTRVELEFRKNHQQVELIAYSAYVDGGCIHILLDEEGETVKIIPLDTLNCIDLSFVE